MAVSSLQLQYHCILAYNGRACRHLCNYTPTSYRALNDSISRSLLLCCIREMQRIRCTGYNMLAHDLFVPIVTQMHTGRPR